jgi:hypothetical protein
VRHEIDCIDERDRLRQSFDFHIYAINARDPAEAGAILFGDEFVSRQRRELLFQNSRDLPDRGVLGARNRADRIAREMLCPNRFRFLSPVD